MQEIITPLAEFARAEMTRLSAVSLPSTAREIADGYQRRHLLSWAGPVLVDVRRETYREAMKQGYDTTLNASGANDSRFNRFFAKSLLIYIRQQTESCDRGLQPNELRLRASGSGSVVRSQAYVLSEEARRDFMVALDQRARAIISGLFPDVCVEVDGPRLQGQRSGEMGRFVDRGGHEHALRSASSVRFALSSGECTFVEMYSSELEKFKDLMAARPLQSVAAPISCAAYGHNKQGWPQRDILKLAATPQGVAIEPLSALAGWGDRDGEELLRFDPTPGVVVSGGGRTKIIDHAGAMHMLVDGTTAAAMVMKGLVPELKFSESSVMHDALNTMGGFLTSKKSGRTCALSTVRYVIYQESPCSGKWRDFHAWSYGANSSFSDQLAGWGFGPGDALVEAQIDDGAHADQFWGDFQAVFSATGRGVVEESVTLGATIQALLVNKLSSDKLAGITVQGVSISIRATDNDRDSNCVLVQADVRFRSVKGSEVFVGRGPLLRGVNAEVVKALWDRSEGAIFANSFTFLSVDAVQLEPAPTPRSVSNNAVAGVPFGVEQWGMEP